MDTLMGQAAPRLEASLKVTGAARYPGEMPMEGLLHATLVTAPIAHGRVLRIDTAKARALPGVVDILTHENADRLPPTIATLGLGKVTLRAAGTILHEQLKPKGIRVSTITIAGAIEAGGPLDPDKIAEFYWDVCSSPVADWPAEHRFESRVEAGRTTS